MSGSSRTLSPAQVQWMQDFLGVDSGAFVTPMGAPGPIGVNVPLHQVGAALDGLGASGRTQLTPNNIKGAGPAIRVPMNADGTPTRVLEVGAGGTPTDLGLPPDPNLVQVTRTDVGRPGLPDFDATQPPPPEIAAGQFDAAIINNPRGFQPNLDHVADTLRPGGNIIAQGNVPHNPDFTAMLDTVPPPGGGTTPSGLQTLDQVNMAPPRGPSTVVPKPGDVMGGPFYRTGGDPIGWPNTRVTVTRGNPANEAPSPDGLGGAGPGGDDVGMADPAVYGDGPSTQPGLGPTPDEAIPDTLPAPRANLTATPGADPGPLPDYLSGPSKPIKLFPDELGPIEPGSPNLTVHPTPGQEPIPYELGDPRPPGQVQVRPGDGSPVADPYATTQEMPAYEPPGSGTPPGPGSTPAEPTPAGGPNAGELGGAEAGEAGVAGLAGAGVVGGVATGGMALLDDYGKVKSGQMSVGDAAVDVGEKTALGGGLTVAGSAIAKAATGAGAEAVAGAAGAEGAAAAASSVAASGGIIGGVVSGGMALVDDVGKVRSGQMTGGAATVDVGAKTAVGVAAGMAGAEVGAEVGAAVGSIIPGAGTAIGFVAGAVVGAGVGYLGNKLMESDTGKELLKGAGEAVDGAIDGAKEVGSAVASAAGAAADAASGAAGAVAGAAEGVAGAAVDVAGSAAGAVAGAAEGAASAVGGALSSVAGALFGSDDKE